MKAVHSLIISQKRSVNTTSLVIKVQEVLCQKGVKMLVKEAHLYR